MCLSVTLSVGVLLFQRISENTEFYKNFPISCSRGKLYIRAKKLTETKFPKPELPSIATSSSPLFIRNPLAQLKVIPAWGT